MNEHQATILVVDDEVKNVKLMEALLLPRGYRIITAGHGEEALQRVSQERPDLILLDVMMPIMDGFEACKRLKDDPETRLIPVVIMTALGQVEDRVKGIEAGADDFLTKPVHRDELLARIRTSLRLKQTIDHKMSVLQGIQEYLTKFVPQSVKRLVEANPEAPALEKREQDVSVLFVDISGYTRLSETLPQEQVNFIVERYFSSFLDSIYANEGDINETAGDGVMVIFADADPQRHARKAVQTALDIAHRTIQLNAQFQGTFAPIYLHVGINSGVALVGPTKLEGASGTRWTYTASGSVTNLAARIAALSEGDAVLVGPETARRLEGVFPMQMLGQQQLHNISEKVVIYRILGQAEHA
jgi:CheY-like chemotaxis protein/class 3 adenylate cyclase